jgi:dihydrofolate reductase
MRVSLIVAWADDQVIGRDNALPWHLPADLKHFKQLTMGHHLVVGRKTWESIGRALPGRTIIVLSGSERQLPKQVVRAGSLDEALAVARDAGDDEVFIAGGASIYARALPVADRLYLTRITGSIPGDTYFPQVDWSQWHRSESAAHEPDEKNPHPYRFETWERALSKAD